LDFVDLTGLEDDWLICEEVCTRSLSSLQEFRARWGDEGLLNGQIGDAFILPNINLF